MVILDSDKIAKLIEHYEGSPMIHSVLEVFFKQCLQFCELKKCCANCQHRYGKRCRKWLTNTSLDDCCMEWVLR